MQISITVLFFGTFAHVSLHKSFIFCLDLLSKPLLTWSYTVLRTHVILLPEEPSRGVLRKRCSENVQQIYKRTLTPKCDFNKVASNFGIILNDD